MITQLPFNNLLSLWSIAVHAVLNGFMAGLTDSPAGHFDSQPSFCAPLDGSFESPTISIYEQKGRKGSQLLFPEPFAMTRLKEKQRRSFRRSAWHLAARQYFALTQHFVTQPCFISSSQTPLGQTQVFQQARAQQILKTYIPPYLLLYRLYQLIMHQAQVHTDTQASYTQSYAVWEHSSSNHGQSWGVQPDHASKHFLNPMLPPQMVQSSKEPQLLINTKWVEGRKRPGSTRGAAKAEAFPDTQRGIVGHGENVPWWHLEWHQQWKTPERTIPLCTLPRPEHKGN